VGGVFHLQIWTLVFLSPLSRSLSRFLHSRDGHVTVEGVVSGPGIANTYRFLLEQRGGEQQAS
jgi:glucokinase